MSLRIGLSIGVSCFAVTLAGCGTGHLSQASQSGGNGSTASSSPSGNSASSTPVGTTSAAATQASSSTSASTPVLSADVVQVEAALSLLGTSTLTADVESGNFTASALITPSNACVSTTTKPATLNLANLPPDYSVAWSIDNCSGFAGASVNGNAVIDVDRQCAINSDVHANVNITAELGGLTLQLQSCSNIAVQNMPSCHDTTRIVDESGTRVTVSLDSEHDTFDYTTHISVTDSRDPNGNVQKLVFNGTGKLTESASDEFAALHVDQVTVQPATCCYPISGSISAKAGAMDNGCAHDPNMTTAAASKLAFDYSFGPTCGQVTADGNRVITLPACP